MKRILLSIVTISALVLSCKNQNEPQQPLTPVTLHCTQPAFLQPGDKVPRYEVPAHEQNITGQATGVLVGGNICTFAPNLGTQADATLAVQYRRRAADGEH